MNSTVERVLVDCLDDLDRGVPIGEILSRYPQQADELRPFLEMAARLGAMNMQPTVVAQTRSRELFLAQAGALQGVRGRQRRRPFLALLLRPLVALALFVIMGIGFANISARALPGDALYGAKLFIEGAQLSLAGNTAGMEERIRQHRILEIEALLQQNREADVLFSGLIDEVLDDSWRIEGLLVTVAAAELNGEPQVGDFVEVTGWVANGRLIANSITVIEKSEKPPTPTPTAGPTRLPTLEPTITAVPPTKAINNPTPTRTVTVTPTPTVTIVSPTVMVTTVLPTPTMTTVLPTVTAVPRETVAATPDDDHGGGDDNGSGSGTDEPGEEDNSGSGSSNSGSGSGSDDDNSGSGSNDSGSDD